MRSLPANIGRPEARSESVWKLVCNVLEGQIRIPVIQRGVTWEADDVIELFDSIYRGIPIGSLLFQEAPAEAREIEIGPLTVMATERSDALWVVDGQQRLTSLAVALTRSTPLPSAPLDPYVVYFDLETETFHAPPTTGSIASTWVPAPDLLGMAQIDAWLHSWPDDRDAALRVRALAAGRQLRDYRVPLHVIRTTDEELLRTIFTRLNTTRKALTWTDVRDGLFRRSGPPPSSLRELADELETLGMGRPHDDVLLSSLIACRGHDANPFDDSLRTDPKLLEGAAAALPALRTALGFLRNECAIPHLRLLPNTAVLVVLARFFQKHPAPGDRTQTLLPRWVWRTLLAQSDDGELLRRGVAAVISDEEASVQTLLGLAPRTPQPFAIPDHFDARASATRLALLGMAALRPYELEDARPINVTKLIRERASFRSIFLDTPMDGPANRILLSGSGPAVHSLRAYIEDHGIDTPVLRAHAIDPAVGAAIRDDDRERAITLRSQLVRGAVAQLGGRMAAWERTDRPSLEYLMKLAAP